MNSIKFLKFYQAYDHGKTIWIPETQLGPVEVYAWSDLGRTQVNAYRLYTTLPGEDATFVVRPQEVEDLLGITGQPLTMQIVRVVAGRTRNSDSPMWRCYTADDEQINFFQHTDAGKNTFPLLEAADYGSVFSAMGDGEVVEWAQHPIEVTYQMNGDWREPVAVAPRPDGAEPDTFLSDEASKTLSRLQGGMGFETPSPEDDTDEPIVW